MEVLIPFLSAVFEFLKGCLFWMAEHQWAYLALIFPMLIFTYKFYKNNKEAVAHNFVAFIMWVKPSMEENGKASAIKLTGFTFTIGYIVNSIIFMVKLMGFPSTDVWHIVLGGLGILAIYVVTILMLYKIMTPLQLARLRHGININSTETQNSEQDAN